MISEFDRIYMNIAREFASPSKAIRKKVGAVLVTKHGVMLPGYNGTPRGWDNVCESSENITLQTVIHAETNCILKAAKEGISVVDSTVYVTLSPCVACVSMLAQSGVKRIVYDELYRDNTAIMLCKTYGIEIVKITT